MKDALGLVVLIIIVVGSAVNAVRYFNKSRGGFLGRITRSLLAFIGCIVMVYAVLGIVGVILWAVAWVGIFLREFMQWIIEAILVPFRWIVG